MTASNSATARNTGKSSLVGLLMLLRPRQWVKNAFVLAPLVFSGEFLNLSAIGQSLLAALLFSLAASATYVVNDLHDIEHDRRHPAKSRTRPLAAGIVSPPQAGLLLAGLYGALIWAYFLLPGVVQVIAAYLVLNLLYTLVLKHQPVIDIFTIAIGFVLRVYAGAQALAVPVSPWMFVTTLCLALYLAAAKRRQELAFSGTGGRRVLERYSVALVDRYAEMAATGALVFYSLFVISAKPGMVVTIPFVLFGLFRYWYVIEVLDGGESPTDALLSDWQLALTVLLWIGTCIWALWPTIV
ncbi:decaprenyl-phosphate phosphoribosyltransferase [Methylococcus sp. Mc7]|uniref:decaprenyl-phosphate phosphoribosyltransferase n=1 Tax=Methylococcus sp. Mc7 TaxID=2860258 RepID=UPI002106A17C|nr:decaprenyl-phosphate phosphoribosyltransferase [Methylococcus sp. Mc7]